MRKILILLLISNIAFCQKADYIKKLDTVYIAFKNHKKTKRNIYTDNFREYLFNLDLKEKNKSNLLVFSKPDRKNSLTDKNHPVIDTRIENNSFLKKNKSSIIGINFLKKFKEEYIVCELLSKPKVFYIVDFTEKKEGNVNVYRVFLLNYCPIGE